MSTYREFRAETRKRRRRRNLQHVGLVLVIALLLMGLAWFIVQIIEGPKEKPGSTSTPPASEVTSEPTSGSPVPTPSITPADAKTVWDDYAAAERSINTFGVSGTDVRMVSLPAYGRVDLNYFADAVFFGDSITTGWRIYNTGLPNANVVAEIGAAPPVNGVQWARDKKTTDIYDPMVELISKAPKKVYMMFGTNTLVNQTDAAEEKLIADYGTVIDQLQAALPGCDIYIQSILTPTEEAEKKTPGLNPERIARVNSRLAALSVEKHCHYLNLSELLCREGRLNWDIAAGDGTHINADGYRAWLEYLVTHTAYSPTASYIGGSPYAMLSTEVPSVEAPAPAEEAPPAEAPAETPAP